METVHVELGGRSYDVVVGCDILDQFGPELARRGLLRANVAVFTSPVVGAHYYAPVARSLAEAGAASVGRHDIPDGEAHKDLDHFCRAVRYLAQSAPDPSVKPLVVTLGGGVVGDLGGFAAATFRRGVDFVQVPTTLLAAVDSSVGGKTAVNLPEGKNLVGAFHQPRLVYADVGTLRTLPRREVRSGLAEIIKHGAVLDGKLFELLEDRAKDAADPDADLLVRLVPWNVRVKAAVVRQDEREERGVRICLNFGHTIGHAVEKAADGRLTHGEAVAVGMMAAARLSVDSGLCGADVRERLEAVIAAAGLPTRAPGLDIDRVQGHMAHDKKFVTGRNRFVLLSGIGEWTAREDVPEDMIRAATREVLAPAGGPQ
ncbi:MAG: 3-dehydroquinate synthase [Candidatus Brocadiaceae bacterium]|nr:3-dehydroquinate synthase [Candidatus Brocadiaceae bacterium]